MKRPPEHDALLALVEDYRSKLEQFNLANGSAYMAPIAGHLVIKAADAIANAIAPWAPFTAITIQANRSSTLQILKEITIL